MRGFVHSFFVVKMSAHRARLDSSNPHSQFFSASQSLRRTKHPHDSDSFSPSEGLESFDSTPSDERNIFNAIRVVTPNETSTRFYASLNESPAYEQGLAVNMARFVPTGSQVSSVTEPPTEIHTLAGKRSDHRQMLSDQDWRSMPRRKPCPKTANPDSPRCLHRKAVSLGATDSSHGPRWPVNTAPAVVLVHPRYPPPERSPTPPGLPSFGSPEAMRYSARFLMRDNGAHVRPSARGPVEPQSSSSYGEAIRRFFGLSPTAPRIDARSVTGIGRAEDGTIVQGRFPYRQSGHGANVAQTLHDHPFHHLSFVPHEVAEADDSRNEPSHTKGLGTGLRSRHSQSSRPVSRRRSLSPGGGFAFPSSPTSAVVAGPRRPRPVALLELPRDLSGPNVLATAAHVDPVEASSPGSRDTAGHLPSSSSRLHAIFSAVCQSDGNHDPREATSFYTSFVSWVKAQPYTCCCLNVHEEPSDSIAVTSSRDTYTTARSEVSPMVSQNEGAEGNPQASRRQTWISSVCSVMFSPRLTPVML